VTVRQAPSAGSTIRRAPSAGVTVTQKPTADVPVREAPSAGVTAGARPAAAALVELPLVRASGAEQMALDAGLLDEAEIPTVRRYLWSPAAVSLGKFQELAPKAAATLAAAGIDVVRRPSGGRLVLHGEGFEWSFAVVVPAGVLPFGTHAAYRLVRDAMAAALADCGARLDPARDEPYTRSALCFSSALRHDLLVAGAKAVAVAQVRHGDRHLVHGSVLERRPPDELAAAVAAATGESWRAEGLAAGGATPDGAALWRVFVAHLGDAMTHADGGSVRPHDAGEADPTKETMPS
jgi:lipoate-protein ligase A